MYYRLVGATLHVSMRVIAKDKIGQDVATCVLEATPELLKDIARQTSYDAPPVSRVLPPTQEEAHKGFYTFVVEFEPGVDLNEWGEQVANALLRHWVKAGLPFDGELAPM